jgi:polysaccharide export outer membrane protein
MIKSNHAKILPIVPIMILLVIFLATFSSCVNTRQLIYMQGSFDTARLSKIVIKEQVIEKGDVMSIVVYSDNPDATKIYNQTIITTAPSSSSVTGASSGTSTGISGASPAGSGYLVDENGNIEFQGLGLMHVEGLTKVQLKDTLNNRLKDFLVNPYFTVRFLSNKFTMLGEVTKPGIFSIPGDRINLLEALGLCGDLTFYGRRDNILVIREENGKRQFARLDITKPEIIASPYYYLQSNDIVLVEPTKRKIAASDQTTIRNITIGTSIISTLALLYTIFRH